MRYSLRALLILIACLGLALAAWPVLAVLVPFFWFSMFPAGPGL
jgi:hypothetical protein